MWMILIFYWYKFLSYRFLGFRIILDIIENFIYFSVEIKIIVLFLVSMERNLIFEEFLKGEVCFNNFV